MSADGPVTHKKSTALMIFGRDSDSGRRPQHHKQTSRRHLGRVRFAPQSGHARAICPFEDQGHRSFVSACRPAPVIRMRVTSIRRPPATMRSMLVVANPASISSTRSSVLNP